MTTIYTRDDCLTQPTATLNPLCLNNGTLLVTVEIGNAGTYLAFHSAAEIEPYIEALQQALWLARSGEAKLTERAAEEARAAEAEDDAAVMASPGPRDWRDSDWPMRIPPDVSGDLDAIPANRIGEPEHCPAHSPTRYRHSFVVCTLAPGHDGDHEAGGTGPVAYRWAEGSEIDWETEPTAVTR